MGITKTKFVRTSLLIISFYILHCTFYITHATVRFVSTTGSSTPPYTSWETAADSIQKCIDFSVSGDTIIVANGVYYESLIVDKYLWLIGSSMDSTVIDGTDLANITIEFYFDGDIRNFFIKGKGEGISQTACILGSVVNIKITNCRITNSLAGVDLIWSTSVVDNCIISDVTEGYYTSCVIDTCNPIIMNSIILINNSPFEGVVVDGGDNSTLNNIILGNGTSNRGIRSGLFFNASVHRIINNIVVGFDRNIDGYASDTAIVHNNISAYANERGFTIGSHTDMRNNISIHNNVGVVGPTETNSDYNLYWDNNANTTDGLAEHDIVADPMFVYDTIPVSGGTFDYHLQAYSRAIDAGDPNILDVDGTRSDMGVYGGPNGEKYAYVDLAPRPPVNLSAEIDSLDITITWNKNTEADFSFYKIYRDTTAGFTIDSTKLISSQVDTFYIQPVPNGISRLVYKLTAVDSQGNASGSSEELIVNITSVGEYPVMISDYILYQNYSNPFNPSTKIGYRLKERGYVKLMIYDIKGELVNILVNEIKEAGYYEAELSREIGSRQSSSGGMIASGIYIYRIEVIGEGNIPVYSNMKKMILLK
ncbi:hypothetical protein ACFLSS_01165 [Bacteroidota bacterium]